MARTRPVTPQRAVRRDTDPVTPEPAYQTSSGDNYHDELVITFLFEKYEFYCRRVILTAALFRVIFVALLAVLVLIGSLLPWVSLVFFFLVALASALIWEYEKRTFTSMVYGIEREITDLNPGHAGYDSSEFKRFARMESGERSDRLIRVNRWIDMHEFRPFWRVGRAVFDSEPRIWLLLATLLSLVQGLITLVSNR